MFSLDKFQYLNDEKLYDFIYNLLRQRMDEDEFSKHQGLVEDFARINTEIIIRDFCEYAHRYDTQIIGNFNDIRRDWDSEHKDWLFSDMVLSMDKRTVSDEDLSDIQNWCFDWYLETFGTWGLCYNFDTIVSECEFWREKEEAEAC